jgi:hypothetical protein
MELVYTFDTQSNSWSIPKITGDNAIKMLGLTSRMTGVIDNGKMYLWGGLTTDKRFINVMLFLDTINLSFGKGSLIDGPPSGRYDYSAVLLPNNKIIYIGKVVILVMLKKLRKIININIYNIFRWTWTSYFK